MLQKLSRFVSCSKKVVDFDGFIAENAYICKKLKAMKKQFLFFVFMVLALSVEAKVQLPQLFQSGMVLQRGKPIPVWGKADPQEKVIIRWNKKQYATVADANGRWRIDLPKMKAGGPYTMMVNDVALTDVLVGDVWLCSGQSNIDVTIERVYPQYPDEIDHFDNNKVRLFRVQNETNTKGVQDDIRPTAINWKPLNKQNAWFFSAIGSFLGKRMQQQTGVAQGIIVNSWGGTPIEAWISADSLERDYPLQVEKTKLYQDDQLVKSQQQFNQQADQRWRQLLDAKDPGVAGHFSALDYDDSTWPLVNQYVNDWAKTNGRGIVGSIWLRQHVHIDKAHAGQPARLLLGTLFDADFTYVNGKEVGRTYYQYPPRRYDIPEGLLREGDNVITIRFVNKYGTVHFIKEKPYLLAFGPDRFSQNPLPKDYVALSPQWRHHAGAEMPACPSGDASLQNMATTLYNAVLYPLAPYALSGVVWYQGESNTGNPSTYADLLRKMMGKWRTLWNDPTMPFSIVQLANFMEPSEKPQNSGWATLREAQRTVAASDPHAALACLIDLGETVDIHPLRKKEAAERIGLCFDRLVFQKQVTLSAEPLKGQWSADNSLFTLTFDQPLRTGAVVGFEVAGQDGRFVNAEAEANGTQVIIQSPIPLPVKVRYAWKDNPLNANLYGQNNLPATPFEMAVTARAQ